MNKDLLETQWVQAKEYLRDKWSRLTEEDIRQIDGRFDRLSDKLQQRYGYTSAQAEEEIRRWNLERTTKGPSAYTTASDRPYMRQDNKAIRRDEEGSSALKWLLALALPLILLALYLGTARQPETTTTPTTSTETTTTGAANMQGVPVNPQDISVSANTPADQNLVQVIRQSVVSNSGYFRDLRNLRFSVSNGVVTVTGTVVSTQERDRIGSVLNNIAGVRQVNNQVEVRQ